MPTVIATGNTIQEFQAADPAIEELPEGSRGRLIIEGFGLGPVADSAGAEQIWFDTLAPAGVVVEDVYGEGLNTAVVAWRVPTTQTLRRRAAHRAPIAVFAVIGAVVIGLAVLGWTISKVTLLADTLGPGGFSLLVVVLAAAGLVIYREVSRARR